MTQKSRNITATLTAIFIVMALVGSATAFSFEPPKMHSEGKKLVVGQKTTFAENTTIGIEMKGTTNRQFGFQKMFGKYSDHNAFTLTFNNTTAIDFKNYTDYNVPDIVKGAEITFEHSATGNVKFIPKKITGDKPELIISINRTDGQHTGMNVTISLELFRAFLGDKINIKHTVNVTATLSAETVTIHMEHFSTQQLIADGLGTTPNSSMMVSVISILLSAILFGVYAVIHYEEKKKMLKDSKLMKAKKAIFWIGLALLIFGIIEYAYPVLYL